MEEIAKKPETAVERLQRSLQRGGLRGLAKSMRPKKSILLVDTSSSMRQKVGEQDDEGVVVGEKRRIDVLRTVVTDILKTNTVPIAAFSNTTEMVVGRPIPEPAGGTKMHLAIDFAREMGAEHIVIVSDGEPSDDPLTMEAAKKFGGQIDAFFVGDGKGADFLKKLAASTGGHSDKTDLGDPARLTAGIIGYLNAAS